MDEQRLQANHVTAVDDELVRVADRLGLRNRTLELHELTGADAVGAAAQPADGEQPLAEHRRQRLHARLDDAHPAHRRRVGGELGGWTAYPLRLVQQLRRWRRLAGNDGRARRAWRGPHDTSAAEGARVGARVGGGGDDGLVGGQPEGMAHEGRERQPANLASRKQAAHVDVHARREERADRLAEQHAVIAALAQRGDGVSLALNVGAKYVRRQVGLHANLEEERAAKVLARRAHGLLELHRVARVLHPVPRRRLCVERPTRVRRDHPRRRERREAKGGAVVRRRLGGSLAVAEGLGEGALLGEKAADTLEERGQRGLDVGRVEAVVDVEDGRLEASCLEAARCLADGTRVAGEHKRAARVEGGEGERRVRGAQVVQRLQVVG